MHDDEMNHSRISIPSSTRRHRHRQQQLTACIIALSFTHIIIQSLLLSHPCHSSLTLTLSRLNTLNQPTYTLNSNREGKYMETFQSVIVERYGFALQIFLFLAPRDVYKCFCLSKDIKTAAGDELTWKILYFQLCVSSVDPHRVISDTNVLHQMNRPNGRATIGWRVEIDTRLGLVLDFRINSLKIAYKEEYLVLFDVINATEAGNNSSQWVAENDFNYNNSAVSNSRIHFLSPPSVSSQSRNQQLKDKANNAKSDHVAYTPSEAEEKSMRAFFQSLDPPPASWRRAHRTLMLSLPSRHVATVSVHSDEVLDVAFNHTGTLLAAASRDGTFSLTQIQGQQAPRQTRGQIDTPPYPHPSRTTTYLTNHNMHACNIDFSPSNDFVAVVSSNPYDAADGGVLEVFSVTEGNIKTSGDTKKETDASVDTGIAYDTYHDDDEDEDVFATTSLSKTTACRPRQDLSYVSQGGQYVVDDRHSSSLSSSVSPPPAVRFIQAYQMASNIATPWIDKTTILYTSHIHFTDSLGALSRQILHCVDVLKNSTPVTVCLQVYGHASMCTALRLSPGRCLSKPDEGAAAGAATAGGAGHVCTGTVLAYAANAPAASPLGYPQLLCVLPLSAFSPRTTDLFNCPVVDYDSYPHVDVQGAIVGMATNGVEAYHEMILVNVRPHIHTDQDTTLCTALADITQDVEIRAFSAFTLQHIYTFTGHRGFTLKDCPFYIFLDMTSRYSDSPPEREQRSQSHPHSLEQQEEEEQQQEQEGERVLGEGYTSSEVGGKGNRGNNTQQQGENDGDPLDSGVLVASGSEDHKVYIWLGRHASPVQVLNGHTDHVGAVAFNPKIPGMLATASDDATVRIYSAAAY